MGHPSLFFIYYRLFKQTLQFYNKYLSIQYMMLGIEPTTIRT